MKKIELKPILITILLVSLQGATFFLLKPFQSEPYLIGGFIDKMIPFNIISVIPYYIWYLLLVIVPYILYLKDKKSFIKYCLSYIFVVLIADIIFMITPSIVERPVIYGNDILSLMTKFIYWADNPPLNCFPSIHCAISCLFFLYIASSKYTNNIEKMVISFISVLIMISTLTIKQHVLIDLIVGDGIAMLVFMFINKETRLSKLFKKLFKI